MPYVSAAIRQPSSVATDMTNCIANIVHSKKKEVTTEIRWDNHLYNRLRSSAGGTPLFYGLPKVHKPNVPLRPIASFVGSPTYQLSKHLVFLLAPLVGKTPAHVKNSIDFASFISDQTLQQGQMLVSFDVVSLFTNVPVDLGC